ncbi:MAG: hypothetical protein QM666_07650 [Acinetobacter sp.]
MKKIFAFCLLCMPMAVFAKGFDTTLEIRNTHSTYVNRGECSIKFEAIAHDSIDNVNALSFDVTAQTRKGALILRKVITVNRTDFEMVLGKTYFNFYIEGNEACDIDGQVVRINSVIAQFNDGSPNENLIKNKKVSERKFTPVKLVFGQPK